MIDNWWQTETGWPIAANPAGIELLPVKLGSPTVPMPGYDVRILSEAGGAAAGGRARRGGDQAAAAAGDAASLWNADERFEQSYLAHFPGYYETGDAGMLDEDGYLSIMARTDDVINVAGHRLSTGAMEEVLASHPDVAECAVIGIADALKGQLPLGLLCLNKGARREPEAVVAECVAWCATGSGRSPPSASRVVVERLPKTRSGKVLRGTMSRMADGLEWKAPATIDDPLILDEIAASLPASACPRPRWRAVGRAESDFAICGSRRVRRYAFRNAIASCSHFGK